MSEHVRSLLNDEMKLWRGSVEQGIPGRVVLSNLNDHPAVVFFHHFEVVRVNRSPVRENRDHVVGLIGLYGLCELPPATE